MARTKWSYTLFSAIEHKCLLSLKKLNDTRSKITKDRIFPLVKLLFFSDDWMAKLIWYGWANDSGSPNNTFGKILNPYHNTQILRY